ncbi:GGDEF domain-containing protein [Magnetovibrio sp.]|uniref:GGDEF domain-containing protein n=1 Tax=Magnetovibrio sp. TaxID=2024836 RepID=UPI002F95EF73
MGNLLSFPVNAWDLARDTDATSNESLLSALAFLRDCLENDAHTLDHKTLARCKDATESALGAALATDRTLRHQALRIDEMERLAYTDDLTGAYNRRGFQQEFRRVLAAAARYGETGVLVYVDLDGFKPINDTYGHAAGDHVLREVVRTLNENVRPNDLVARLGGDEFAVLLTRTDWQNGLERAEVLKHILNTKYVNWNGKHIAVRASLGFQRFGPDDQHDHLLSQADSAMYEAKRVRTGGTPLKELQ